MIKVAYSNVEKLDLQKAFPLLPPFRKNKASQLKFDKDKKLSCGAYLLLKKMLEEYGIHNPLLKTEKYEKPYISNYPNLHFNLSHSGKYVACTISDRKVGIDIEYNDPRIDLSIAKNFFFNKEYEAIINSNNSANEFFKYWVLKESYMKYTGLGFNLELNSFEIVIDDKIKLRNDKNNIKFSLFDINDYKLAVASKYPVEECVEYDVKSLY